MSQPSPSQLPSPSDVVTEEEYNHLLTSFQNASLNQKPFPYCEIPECLSERFYAELLKHLPAFEECVPKNLKALTNMKEMNRLTAIIGKHPLGKNQEFWNKVNQVILNPTFLKLLMDKFLLSPQSQSQSKFKLQSIRGEKVFFQYNNRSYSAESIIYRDKNNYELEVHTDTRRRFMTVIWYLPPLEMGDKMSKYGTSLYEPKNPNFKDPKGARHSFNKFNYLKTIPFLPRYGFAFRRNDQSFHAVETFDLKDIPRDTLGINIRTLN